MIFKLNEDAYACSIRWISITINNNNQDPTNWQAQMSPYPPRAPPRRTSRWSPVGATLSTHGGMSRFWASATGRTRVYNASSAGGGDGRPGGRSHRAPLATTTNRPSDQDYKGRSLPWRRRSHDNVAAPPAVITANGDGQRPLQFLFPEVDALAFLDSSGTDPCLSEILVTGAIAQVCAFRLSIRPFSVMPAGAHPSGRTYTCLRTQQWPFPPMALATAQSSSCHSCHSADIRDWMGCLANTKWLYRTANKYVQATC